MRKSNKKALLGVCLGLCCLVFASAAPVHIFILAGQSNMVGTGNIMDLPQELKKAQEQVIIYNGGTGEYGWTTLQPGVGAYSGSFGPEVTFGRDISAAFPGETIALIKVAWSGSSLAYDWLSPSAGNPGPYWLRFTEHLASAMESLPPGLQGEIEGMCWMQGESDACNIYPASDYESNLRDFISDVRTLVNKPVLPFIIAMIDDTPVWQEYAVVREAQQNLAASLAGVGIFDTADYPADAGHYHSEGLISMGEDFATVLLPLLNATPGATPTPVLLPGDANGDKRVSILDALMTAQFSVGLNPPGFFSSAADVNADGRISIIDALIIAQACVGLVQL